MHRRYPLIQMVLLCLLCSVQLAGYTQTSLKKSIEVTPVKTYTVGDKVPDLVFKNLINSRLKQMRLNDYKGKLVIIDFWEWGCVTCMESFPKIELLQKEFADKLQVITVTSRISPEYFQEKKNEFHSLKDFTLPTVMRDDQLRKYFPFDAVSHLVWIDGNGFVKAITGSDYVTAENIRLALSDKPVPWAVKKDVIGFDYEKPLFSLNNETVDLPSSVFYSAFTGYLPGISGGVKEITDSTRQIKTINIINQGLLAFCDGSLDGQGAGYIHPKYLALEVKDSSRFLWDPHVLYFNQWLEKTVHSYSVTIPLWMSAREQQEFIKNDLTRWLALSGISVRKELREVNCYALVTTKDNKAALRSKGGETKSRFNFPDDQSYIRNDSLAQFIYYLNKNNMTLPGLFKDSTGLPADFLLDMKFSKDAFSSIPQLRKELLQYGFDLVPSSCRVEMHVITEKNFR